MAQSLFNTDASSMCKTCAKKKSQTGEGISSALHGTFISREIAVDAPDVPSAFRHVESQIRQHLADRLNVSAIRFYIRLEVDMARETDEGTLTVPMVFQSNVLTITTEHQIEEIVEEIRMALEKTIEDFTFMGSGWQLVLVKKIILKTGTYNPLGGFVVSSHAFKDQTD